VNTRAMSAVCENDQPNPTITNPPIISVVAPMKIAVSNGVMIQWLRMASP
jgi:hypothetical protein